MLDDSKKDLYLVLVGPQRSPALLKRVDETMQHSSKDICTWLWWRLRGCSRRIRGFGNGVQQRLKVHRRVLVLGRRVVN